MRPKENFLISPDNIYTKNYNEKNRLTYLTLFLAGLLVFSCQQDDENPMETIAQPIVGNTTKLGEKLQNPYSIENMQKALDNLKKSKLSKKSSSINNIEISTTHLYLRYKPKNNDELDILKADSTLVLYDYPLDYQIIEQGDFYKDPETKVNQPTYQYCAVVVDKKLPKGLEYEILASLFIPDEDKDPVIENETFKKSYSADLADDLVDEALRITNNLNETSTLAKSNLAARRRKWRPAGTVKVWDDVLNKYVGVEGVKVRARRWFTTHRGIANADGYYSCDGRFRRDANYSIDWERHEFALQDGWLNGATYNGPKKRGNWDLNLKDDKQAYYATIFRAAHHYYYKDINGLRRPPQNSLLKTQMKIRAYLENVSDEGSLGTHSSGWRAFGLSSPIKMYTYQRSAIETYVTTLHELAHASHWNMGRNDFSDTSTKVKESWARGVQWELGRMTYPDYLGREFSRQDYTLIVSDMLDDDFNTIEARTNFGYYRNVNDQVANYTIRQIEDALNGQKNWNDWRNNIRNIFNNSTEGNLDRLFLAYE